MELQCQLCKRPFRKPNIGLYNIPTLGAVCCDCMDNLEKFQDISLTIGNYRKIVAAIKTRLKYAFKDVKVEYNSKFYNPFQITLKQTETSATSINFQTLDQLKFLHEVLGKFIEQCEVDYKQTLNYVKCKEN